MGEARDHATTVQAAQMLGVSPATLRHWCTTFGFPTTRIENGRRSFDHQEITLLRDLIPAHSSIASAVQQAKSDPAASRTQESRRR